MFALYNFRGPPAVPPCSPCALRENSVPGAVVAVPWARRESASPPQWAPESAEVVLFTHFRAAFADMLAHPGNTLPQPHAHPDT